MRLGFFFSFFLCLDITISGKDFNQFFPPKMSFCIGKLELGTFYSPQFLWATKLPTEGHATAYRIDMWPSRFCFVWGCSEA